MAFYSVEIFINGCTNDAGPEWFEGWQDAMSRVLEWPREPLEESDMQWRGPIAAGHVRGPVVLKGYYPGSLYMAEIIYWPHAAWCPECDGEGDGAGYGGIVKDAEIEERCDWCEGLRWDSIDAYERSQE
jgi:hypothetical protein